MLAEHPRGLGSTKFPKPEPRIQIPAQAGSSGRLPASLHLPFLIFKGVGTSILPEAPIRASETDLTLFFPSSPHLTIGESGGLYLQIIWNPIMSSSSPPLLRGNTVRHFPALSASTQLQTAYSQRPSRAPLSQSWENSRPWWPTALPYGLPSLEGSSPITLPSLSLWIPRKDLP